MATALDLLMSTKEDVNLLSEESDICTIDAKTRIIFVPSTIVVGGVQSDKNAERIKFSCPKIVGDNLDLSKFSVRINFENVSSVDFNVSIKDQYICDDVAVDGENVTFSWLIGRNAARYMGTVRFIVCAVKTDSDSNISVEWNTTIAEVPVLEGIEIDQPQIGQEEKDVINQLLELTKNTSAEAVQNVNSAKEQAIKNIQSVSQPDTTLTIEGGLAEAKATGEAIGSLKEDLDNKIIQSVNLFDGKIKQNYYINQTTGEETAYTDWCCSDFIKTNPSIEYYCYALNSSNVFSKAGNIYYAFYDKNKRYITGNIFYNNVASIISNNINVNYIRISGPTSVFTSFLIFGEKTKIDFIAGKDRLSFIPFETSIPNINKMFNGKILMTYGDSITAQGKWQPYVKNECGFYKVIKHGYPGDRLMRLACTDYIDTLTEDFDILTVMGGTNDFGQDRVIGKPTDVNTDDKDSSFTGTFYGGLNLLIPSLMTKFPQKRIVFITPVIGKRKNSESFFNKAGSEDGMVNSNGNTIRDFANAIIDRCEYYGMPYIDLTTACGWNKYNISNYCQNEDENFIHPNENGAIRMATFISSQLKNFTN